MITYSRSDEETGGVLAIHEGHKFDKQNDFFGISRRKYGIYTSNVLFKKGYRVIMQNDIGVKSADMLLNGVKCDTKGIEKNGNSQQKVHLGKLIAKNLKS